MTVFEHNPRARIFNAAQHPYKHPLSDFVYANDKLPSDVSDLQTALDYIFAVLYPNSQDSVATTAALPSVGNTVGDFRVVNDDGDGKAAGYQWQQREGDASAKWYKIYDMDWGEGSILSGFLSKTQDLYVYKAGYNDLDYTGALLTGVNAGQHIYGGATASKHLTLHANSGDGVGSQTGYVQVADNFRPQTDNTWDSGTTTEKWKKVWARAINVDTMTLTTGSIADTSGSISFGALNLSTSGTLASGTHTVGNMVLASASLTNTSGSISFDNENLSTTGTLASGTHTIGTLVLAAASITDTSGSISFDNENLSTTGTLAAGNTTVSRLDSGNTRVTGNTISITNTDGSLILQANGTGVIDAQYAMTSLGITATGTVSATVKAKGGNLSLSSNTLASENTNGNIILAPNGSGTINASAKFLPSSDATYDIGATASRFKDIFFSGNLGDGTTTIAMSVLQSLRSINSGVSSGMTIFWDGSKWAASLPDTEVSHHTISDLTNYDDHTQYMYLAGRSGGQSLVGGTAASENMTLESTAHGTKGKILCKDVIAPNTNASYSSSWSGTDIGSSSKIWRHVYTAGEFIGLRVENLTSDPSPSVQNPGRLFWNSVEGSVKVDTGTAIKKIESFNYYTDTSWDGSTLVKNVTVSGVDATKCLIQLRDNTNNYEVMYVKIEATTTTNVRITVGTALPAGSYRLILIQAS